jgi:BirA family biotin operon repressor/biotin-[acetyl-CoA-carboxylase] ligase
VLVAEEQTSGRGRQGRRWVTEPGAALTFSVLLRPVMVAPAGRGWLPLLTGVALTRALRQVTGVDVTLKWPNDVLAGGSKLAGILAEQAGEAIVVGIGLNISAAPGDLLAARPGALPATSLAMSGATTTDRGVLLVAVLRELADWYRRWTSSAIAAGPAGAGSAGAGSAAEASGLRAEYVRCCSTIGADVRVELPGRSRLAGVATGIDQAGRLLVDSAGGVVAVSAGDVIHVR